MDESPVHERLREQQRRNHATRGAWQRFARHRHRITSLLTSALASSAPAPRLVVLGAGNCNDLELADLRTRFSAIDLLDCDCDSVSEGIARQKLAADPAIRAVGPLDLASLARFTAGRADQPLTDAEIDVAIDPTRQPPALPVPQADVVASVCVLSQILESLALEVGVSHPRYRETVQRERSNHFRLMINQLRPGGTGLLVTDLVSSDTLPQLLAANELALPELARTCVQQGNFFTGLNPAVVHALLTTDPDLSPGITDVVMVPPWTWDLGPRVYLVYAVRFQRIPEPR
jgi:hypothetical protein